MMIRPCAIVLLRNGASGTTLPTMVKDFGVIEIRVENHKGGAMKYGVRAAEKLAAASFNP